jgi:hypothetical protein
MDMNQHFSWEISEKAPVVFRMCGGCQCQSLFGRIRNEELLSGDTNAFATIARVNLRHMGL